jgi:hypothetical protein
MTTTLKAFTVFAKLIDEFDTPEELFDFLKSPAGGSLDVLIPEKDAQVPLALIHYVKGKSDMTLPHVDYFRSVIWNLRTHRPVCVAPVRSRKFSDLIDNRPEWTIVEDFVDGIMINMFWDGQKWRVATRTRIDAGGKFYGTRPFSQLFWDTLASSRIDPETHFDKSFCYSFVLQHPDERIVVAPAYGIPKLFLVEATKITSEGDISPIILSRDGSTWIHSAVRPLMLERHTLLTLEDIKCRVAAWGRRYGPQWQGLVIKTDGKRWKIRSDQYMEARALRGNQPNRTYLWLERWAGKQFDQYVKLYPEEKTDAEAVVARFKACTQELYDLYQKVYRAREFPLGQAPQKYRKLLWDAHQANKGAYFRDLREFMNAQDTARKVWLVNYETRYGPAGSA